MSCNCCCTNTLNFCDQSVCGEIDFDIAAQVSGVHKMKTEFLGKQIIVEAEIPAGENIIFPLDGLNENFQYTVELYDPNDAKILIRKNEVDYDCFRFGTVLSVTLNKVDVVES